jgi:hypothetical protein
MSKKKKIVSKKLVEIEEGELNLESAKVKLSMWVDGAIVVAARKEQLQATGSEKGYQTLINQKLREIFLQPDPKLQEVERRLTILEKLVVGK